jgi:hypothetical protein
MACPKCRSEGPFYMEVTLTGYVSVADDGFDYNDIKGAEATWEDRGHCACEDCGFEGMVFNFKESNNG